MPFGFVILGQKNNQHNRQQTKNLRKHFKEPALSVPELDTKPMSNATRSRMQKAARARNRQEVKELIVFGAIAIVLIIILVMGQHVNG